MSEDFGKARITNNLNHEIDIYDIVYETSSTTGLRTCSYTKVGTVAAKETKELQMIRGPLPVLEAHYTGKIEALENAYYYNFPIKFMIIASQAFPDAPALEHTIKQEDLDRAIQTLLFHRFTMANPDASLTKDLYNAMKDKASEDSVNQFFANTTNFKDCTNASWTSVMFWLQYYISGWQGPYYLYQEAPSPIPENYTPVLIAVMVITSTESKNSAMLTTCSQDKHGNPVYSDPPQSTNIIMNGDRTMGEKDRGKDLSLSLTPVWVNVLQTHLVKGVPTSNYYIGPSVTGTVANTKVVSTGSPRQMPGKTAQKKDHQQIAQFDAGFNKFSQTVGLVVGLLMLGEFAKKIFTTTTSKTLSAAKAIKEKGGSLKDYLTKKKNIEETPDSSIESELSDDESRYNSDASEISSNYDEIGKGKEKVAVEEEVVAAETKDRDEVIKAMEDGAYTPDREFNKEILASDKAFAAAKESAEEGRISDANKDLGEASTKVSKAVEIVQKEDPSASLAEELKESSEEVQEVTKENESLNKANEERESPERQEGEGGEEPAETTEPEDFPVEI